MGPKFTIQLTAVLIAAAALANISTAQSTESSTSKTASPVAYIYVSRPTHLDAFAASSSGKLTPVPGSPFSNIDLSHMSVTKKFLFGASDDNESIYSYSVASNGAVKEVSKINTHDFNPQDNNCFDVGPTQLDRTGTILYNDDWNCDGDSQYIQSYKINSDGSLTFLANSGGASEDWTMGPPVVLGTNGYLYVAGFYGQGGVGGLMQSYKRQSNGAMELDNPEIAYPAPKQSGYMYFPNPVLAADSSDHIAAAMQLQSGSGEILNPVLLASFTAQSNGNLTTSNTQSEMASTALNGVYVMSISPANNFLAVAGGGPNHPAGGKGFQIFRFNGGSPIKADSGVLQSKYLIDQLGWDKSNHLYALGGGYLFVYNVTTSGIEQVSGSPYSIPEASSLIVLDLQ